MNLAYLSTICRRQPSSSLSLPQTCSKIKSIMKQREDHAWPGPIICSKIALTGRQTNTAAIVQVPFISNSAIMNANVSTYANIMF